MREFHLKILLNTSEDHVSRREQFIKDKVLADGLHFAANGRVYDFWKREEDGSQNTVAMYPTNSTIIEKIKR